jgi:2,4-dienoyl-CoA reductase-like NADH-dependent reductase (Old Yellow Enzyme family)
MNTGSLFEPFQLGSLTLPNRIVMAPMTRSQAPGGIPVARNATYYRRRAEGGAGLILSEGTTIDRPASRNDPEVPLFHGERALSGWAEVLDAVHATGARMGPQIWHVGAVRSERTEWVPDADPESASGLVAPDMPRGVAMDDEAISDAVAAFANAAADAKRLGFDTVEIHGAHGYLIDQFFWSGTNHRNDRYNGTIRDRSRFGAEVVKAVRTAVGPEFPIIMRVSQWKQQDYAAKLATTPDELTEWLGPLVEAGVDVFHCSQRRFWDAEFPEIDGEEGLNLAGWAKKMTGAATITVGSVGLSGDFMDTFAGRGSAPAELDRLVARLDRGEFDLVAVGRALVADPDWARKVRDGAFADLMAFRPDMLAELA